jgi:UDP-glucose 4-epimerase
MKVSGARVLVTGGAGFVGSHIVEELIEAGAAQIIAVDNMVRGRPENLAPAMSCSPVTLVRADIRNRDQLDSLVRGSDIVFHQAALRITHCAADPDEAFEVMVRATYDLARMCVAHGVKRLIMASSASIYGMAEHFPTGESEPPYSNRTFYGAAKLFSEGLLRALNDMNRLSYVALRYFNVYGPRMDIHGRYTEVLIRWMERIEAGERPILFGDGSETMDMIHVRDVARANILAARASVDDVALNIGSATETSLYQLAKQLARAMGRGDLEPEYAPRRAVNAVPRRLADIAAARQALSFEPSIALEDGLCDLVAWWRRERRSAALQPLAQAIQ